MSLSIPYMVKLQQQNFILLTILIQNLLGELFFTFFKLLNNLRTEIKHSGN